MNEQYDAQSKFFYNILEQYKLTTSFNSSRIRQDLTKEQSTSKDYKGREIYELIQNAEDEKSDYVSISLDTVSQTLIVANRGANCRSFSEGGFCSIMMTEMSPKMISQRAYIGSKGLGFRSLINWAEEISIESGGVCCSFSRAIAADYWNVIKQFWSNKGIDNELAKQHENFAEKNFGLSTPLPMLSVPKVKDAETHDYITKIIVRYKQNCFLSIKEQLTSLSGKVLLFLKNIKRIDINIDDSQVIISRCDDTEDFDSIKNIITYDPEHPNGQKWLVYQESDIFGNDRKYEISLAFDPIDHESGKFVYTFFPTRVRMSLPLVLHATFELNSSRNSINESDANNEMQRLIAKAIIHFAETLARKSSDNDMCWIYYDCTSLKEDTEKNEFPILCKELNQCRDRAMIFPTIAKGYLSYEQTRHYDEDWASFLMQPHVLQCTGMERHLIKGYSERSIRNQVCDDSLTAFVNEYSKAIREHGEDIAYRAQFIASLINIRQCQSFKVLVDEDYNIIEREARINVGESIPYLPQEMNITYVSEELIAKLIYCMNIEESAQKRAVTKLLRKNSCADVSDMDINTVKRSIISYSKNAMTIDGFKQLMFVIYRKSQDSGHDCNFKEMFMHHDFCIFNAEGEKCFPCEVVIGTGASDSVYALKYQLYGTLSDWRDWFSAKSGTIQEEKEIRDFFINVVGVSSHVPQNYQPLNNDADYFIKDYCVVFKNCPWQFEKYYSQKFTGFFEHKNWFRIAKQDFLNELVQHKGYDLARIIMLLKSDKVLLQELRNSDVWYSYNGIKRDEFEIGYALYKLRSWDIFSPLQSYVVSERLCLNADVQLENQLNNIADDYEVASLLILLGAKAKLNDLKNDELYQILRSIPEKQLKKGVRPIYKAIREAIIGNQERNDLSRSIGILAADFAKDGLVYARRNGGDLAIKPVSEVYYWDNDQLPKQLLQSKWKLEIGNRVGEKSVKEIFGVKLADEISIKIDDNIRNDELTRDVLSCLHSRYRYILAYRFHSSRDISESGRIQLANSLKNIRLNIYHRCSYSNESEHLNMVDGDMITQNEGRGIVFHVCAQQKTFADAIKSPVFCENLMEIICMSLKVTSNDMANSFRSILKNTEEENLYISHREILEEEWVAVDKALGLSDFEKVFWTNIGKAKGVSIDFSKLRLSATAKIAYLREILPEIVLPDYFDDLQQLTSVQKYNLSNSLGVKDASVWGEYGLLDYYLQKMEELRQNYRNSYVHYCFDHINRDSFIIDKAEQLYCSCKKFDEDWYYNTSQKISLVTYSEAELKDCFIKCFEDSFGIDISKLSTDDSWHLQPLQCYIDILKEWHIDIAVVDQHDLCFTCFGGNEECFRKALEKYRNDNKDLDLYASCNNADRQVLKVRFGVGHNKDLGSRQENRHIGSKGKGYQSERVKLKAGRIAERKVLNAMIADKEHFHNVRGWSRNLDPVNGRDDLHYDITYSPVKDGNIGPTRYLEVKSMSSDSIIMSIAEHEFAQTNKLLYDFALVQGDDITFIIQPFAPTDGSPSLKAYPDTMKISLSISILE